MNSTNQYEREAAEREKARQFYEELRWRVAFLKEREPNPAPEPTEQQILAWYRQIPAPVQSAMIKDTGNEIGSINHQFEQLFPSQTQQYGPACLEMGVRDGRGEIHAQPLVLNHDLIAAVLTDPGLGLEVVYYEPDLTFYYRTQFEPVFKPVSPEKLACLYRGLILRMAEKVRLTQSKLNIWAEFRSDKNCRLIIQRAKSILAVSTDFFSPTSLYQRVKGQELLERVARRFVGEMLTSEPGQTLKLVDAFEAFRCLIKQCELPDIKRSDFKAVVVPLIREQFDVALRNDLCRNESSGVRGWKGVKLLQTEPFCN